MSESDKKRVKSEKKEKRKKVKADEGCEEPIKAPKTKKRKAEDEEDHPEVVTSRPRTRSFDANEKKRAAALAAKEDDSKKTSIGTPLSNFKLNPVTVAALIARNVHTLFEIQAKTFDSIRSGIDVIGRARTGMGKTLAFALPMAEMLHDTENGRKYGRPPIACCLVPTRELAKQVAGEIESVCPGFTVLCVYGGSPYPPQLQALRAGIDVVVGTPGRIKDHLEKGTLDLATRCQFAVLDEADQMLDMGFADDMEIILGACTLPTRQTCLFSATMPKWVKDVAVKYMKDPTTIDVVGNSAVRASTDVRHIAIPTHWDTKAGTISDIISMYAGTQGRVIIFCETKLECNELSMNDSLKFESKALHGDVPQATRETTMEAFRKGKFRVLIATDVAARGLDMIVDLVIQNKPPESRSGRPEVDTYIHRSGRTGRAGRKGICVVVFSPKQRACLQIIERETKNTFEWLGAPQPQAIMLTAGQTAADDAVAVKAELRNMFNASAQSLLDSCDGNALSAVSAALAVAAGYTEAPPCRSLLSSAENYVTMMFDNGSEVVNSFGLVWAALRRVFPAGFTDGTERFRGMTMTETECGAVFDVKTDESCSIDDIKEHIKDCPQLSIIEKLPKLKEKAMFSVGKGGGKGKGKGSRGKGKGGRSSSPFGGRGGGRGKGR